MYKLSFKEAAELEIQLPTLDYGESRRVPEKHVFLFNDYAKAFVWITTNWKILKKIGLPDHLTYLLINLYIRSNSQKKKKEAAAIVRTRHEQLVGSKLGKEYN